MSVVETQAGIEGGADGAAGESAMAIDLSYVSKTYRGGVQALRGISMKVHRGEIFGLLGPNGAGKSTLVKILMTVIRASRCEGRMLGDSIGTKRTLRRIGYLPEHHRFPEYLTGRQVLDHFGAMSDVPRDVRKRRAGELLEIVGLTAWGDSRVKSYSKGMRQRLGVAQAMINDPDLILLDEPTDGVDPVGRRDIRNVLQDLKRRGKTVFLNSHLLSELEMVCDRLAIMVQGTVTSQGTLAELTAYGRRYEVEVGDGVDVAGLLRAASLVQDLEQTGSLDDLARVETGIESASFAGNGGGNGGRVGASAARGPKGPVLRGTTAGGIAVEVEGSIIRLMTEEAAAAQPIIDAIRARGVTVRAVRPMRPSLEDLFMRAITDPVTGRELRPGAGGAAAGKGGRR